MRERWISQSLRAVLLLGIPTWVSVWGVSLVPFNKLPLSHFWQVMAYRAFSVAVYLVMIWALKPGLLRRFRFHVDRKRLWVAIGVLVILVGRDVVSAPYSKFSVIDVIGAFVFTMAIGLDEEVFSRVMIFGFFEKYGVWVAAGISSLHSGALHIGNAFWGDQSWDYTIAQVINAAAFGFLCCGLMLYTGSVWIPILLHGLSDLPMQFMTESEYVANGHASTDWVGLAIAVTLYTGIGAWLIYQSNQSNQSARSGLERLSLRFGLISEGNR